MGKRERADDARSQKAAAKKERRTRQAENDPTVPALTVTVVFAIGLVIVSDLLFQSQTEGRAHFFARLFCFMLLESSFGSLFSLILLQPARRLVAWMPGGVAADEGGGQAEGQELHWGRHQPLGPWRERKQGAGSQQHGQRQN